MTRLFDRSKRSFGLFLAFVLMITLLLPAAALPKASAATITIDGNVSDWSSVSALTTNSGTAQTLKVTNDGTKLYLLIQGSGLSTTMGNFWINTDNNTSTGYQAAGWGVTGVEWLLENTGLYRYGGSGTDWVWNFNSTLTSSQFYRSSTVIEIAIPLATLQISAGSTVRVGYIDNSSDTSRLPASGQTLPAYLLTSAGSGGGTGNNTVVNPVELDSPLNNPFKGWAPSAKSTTYAQPHRLVYAGVTWKELESTKGTFDFSAIEAANNFAYWKSKGVKVVFRFILDSPTGQAHRDIPDWLYNDMIARGESPGTVYNDTTGGMGTGNNMGFSPNYNSTYLQERHKLAIEAIAARYNTNDRPVAFVQIGSLGHWGEFHTWPYVGPNGETNYTGAFPTNDISNKYVQHYIDAFAGKEDKMQVLIRRSIALAKTNNKGMVMGMFNDVFGHKDSFDADWGWYTGTQNGYWDDIGQQQPAHANFWETRISGGEFYGGASGMLAALTTGSGFTETLRQTELSKPSWLGPNSPASLPLNHALQANIDALKKRMGYHFVVKEISHPSTISGSTFTTTIKVENKGVQHFPFAWPVEIQLRSGNTVVAKKTTTVNLTTWKTGTYTLTDSIPVSSLAAGTYDIAIAIIDPETNKPGVDFANTNKLTDGSFKLSSVTK
ncbi:DUF4832 domain-containing protein [Paenibacillus marchantiae]|uniref:DUF4832 domain-containing protein n=1 Tax=Paenibacillus marchantiae TaxID=3026433 RepID=UPI00237A1FA8|nr:DUF4832 domain-containing protein [Paenibacillus marchantiae]WDQ34588.1 DUF4832 domain-containing protein [Paenibacillus marchantiae]